MSVQKSTDKIRITRSVRYGRNPASVVVNVEEER